MKSNSIIIILTAIFLGLIIGFFLLYKWII
jgi:uncharacterized protein YneF (UPF0154 family)